MTDYPYRMGTAAYILNRQNKLLIVSLNNYRVTEWSVPGGGRNEGETAEQNILRELKEELFIEANDLKLIGRPKTPMKYEFPPKLVKERKQIGQVKDQFVFRYLLEKPHLDFDKTEIRAAMWCDLDTISKYLVFPGQLQTATKVLAEFGLI